MALGLLARSTMMAERGKENWKLDRVSKRDGNGEKRYSKVRREKRKDDEGH